MRVGWRVAQGRTANYSPSPVTPGAHPCLHPSRSPCGRGAWGTLPSSSVELEAFVISHNLRPRPSHEEIVSQ